MLAPSLLLALWLATEGDAGPPPPSAVASTPAPEPVAVHEAALPPFAVARIRTAEPVVALTFDACATLRQDNGFDRAVFEILKRERIPVTVFTSGRWIETHPDAARELAAQDWIEIANHSYSHPRMTGLPRRREVDEIARTEAIVATLGRKSTAFRPPAGAWNRTLVRLAAQAGLPTVQWDVVSGDAGGHVPAAKMVAAVLGQTKPGSIVIFHINERGPFTKDALPDIIRGLRGKGMHFVTISQLLALPGAKPVAARLSPLGYYGRRKPKPAPASVESN